VLVLQYGADIVYLEETIDKRLLASRRIVNSALGTIDYIDGRDNSLVLRVCPEERGRLVVQLGTSDGPSGGRRPHHRAGRGRNRREHGLPQGLQPEGWDGRGAAV
jgi:hypothetical protein